jgi:hypothetical protein
MNTNDLGLHRNASDREKQTWHGHDGSTRSSCPPEPRRGCYRQAFGPRVFMGLTATRVRTWSDDGNTPNRTTSLGRHASRSKRSQRSRVCSRPRRRAARAWQAPVGISVSGEAVAGARVAVDPQATRSRSASSAGRAARAVACHWASCAAPCARQARPGRRPWTSASATQDVGRRRVGGALTQTVTRDIHDVAGGL